MGFIKDVKQGLREKGIWLDDKQARIVLALIQRGYATGHVRLSKDEADVVDRLAKRCGEFRP